MYVIIIIIVYKILMRIILVNVSANQGIMMIIKIVFAKNVQAFGNFNKMNNISIKLLLKAIYANIIMKLFVLNVRIHIKL